MDLSVELFNHRLKNPLVLPSGILGTSRALLKRVANAGVGVVTIKSISIEPRKGHLNPTVIRYGDGFINSMGYPNMGLKEAINEYKDLSSIGCPVIGSIVGECSEEFGELAAEFDKLDFMAIEVPLSCPHTPRVGLMSDQTNPLKVEEIITKVVQNTSKPVLLKLPATGGLTIAASALNSGVSGFTATNTVGQAMLIDVYAKKPQLGFRYGGLSGPALKPLAIATVYSLYGCIPKDHPIIGTGGVSRGNDVIEYIMAGAAAVGVGSIIYKGLDIFEEILQEVRSTMEQLGETKLSNLKGVAQC